MGRSTHCRKGHELTPDNVRLSPKGHRMCLTCSPLQTQCSEGHALTPDNVYPDKSGVKCKICTIARSNKWVKLNPGKRQTARKKWEAENPDFWKTNYRRLLLRSEYGLTVEQYESMRAAQGEVCAICKQPETTKGVKHLSVDHNHQTNTVRALLCRKCNSGLGHFADDVALLGAAVEYLQRHDKTPKQGKAA